MEVARAQPNAHTMGVEVQTQTRKMGVKNLAQTRKIGVRQRQAIVRCQCYDVQGQPCANPVVNNTPFCSEHQNCKGSPLSGAEPRYNPGLYNDDNAVRLSHNCYSYAMGVIDLDLVKRCRKSKGKNCRTYFHQPGALGGDRYALNTVERRTCPNVVKLMKSDVPNITDTTFHGQCPATTSKIALVVDKGEDYHFYRLDSDGKWSHKDGSNKVKRYDAQKQPIMNPGNAARDYTQQGSDINYEDVCGYYCVPRATTVRLGQGGMRQNAGSRKTVKSRARPESIPGLSWRDHRRSVSRRKGAKATRRSRL